jgi:hypothetical protein
MVVDNLSDFLGTASGRDIALGTWPVLVKRRYKAKDPGNAARGFMTVPIRTPCAAGHITLAQYGLLCGRDMHCGNNSQTRRREGTHKFHCFLH